MTVNMDCYITLYNYVLLFYIFTSCGQDPPLITLQPPSACLFVCMGTFIRHCYVCCAYIHAIMYAYVLLVFVRRIWNLNSMLIKDTAEHVCRLMDIMDIARRGVEESFIWHGGATGHFPVSCSPFSGGHDVTTRFHHGTFSSNDILGKVLYAYFIASTVRARI